MNHFSLFILTVTFLLNQEVISSNELDFRQQCNTTINNVDTLKFTFEPKDSAVDLTSCAFNLSKAIKSDEFYLIKIEFNQNFNQSENNEIKIEASNSDPKIQLDKNEKFPNVLFVKIDAPQFVQLKLTDDKNKFQNIKTFTITSYSQKDEQSNFIYFE